MKKLKYWIWAIRPFTISASIVPILIGSSLALHDGIFNSFKFVLVLLASILVQATTNLVDEYSDHFRPERKDKLPAPYKVIALGLLKPEEVKLGALLCFTVAAGIGMYLTIIAGWPILVLCIASTLAVYFYSAGPRPLGSVGLGQPLVFIFMGFVMVAGSYYVQSGRFTLDAFLLSIPIGCTVTAILAANDIRDMEEDQAAGKRTIVTILGRRYAWWEYLFLVAAAFTAIILIAVRSTGFWTLISLLALPQGILALMVLRRAKSRSELALSLPATSRLHLYFGVLLTLGLSAGRYLH